MEPWQQDDWAVDQASRSCAAGRLYARPIDTLHNGDGGVGQAGCRGPTAQRCGEAVERDRSVLFAAGGGGGSQMWC